MMSDHHNRLHHDGLHLLLFGNRRYRHNLRHVEFHRHGISYPDRHRPFPVAVMEEMSMCHGRGAPIYVRGALIYVHAALIYVCVALIYVRVALIYVRVALIYVRGVQCGNVRFLPHDVHFHDVADARAVFRLRVCRTDWPEYM